MEGLFQVMPPLSADEYAELKADIQARGVMVPIEYDEAGAVLDGHHRLKACTELGLKEWPSVVRLGMDESAKRTHARKLNMARRHLNQEQRLKMIKDELTENPKKSDRQVAKDLGVAHTTVSRNREKLVEKGEVVHCTTSTGKDGKEYPRQVERKTAEPELGLQVEKSHCVHIVCGGRIAGGGFLWVLDITDCTLRYPRPPRQFVLRPMVMVPELFDVAGNHELGRDWGDLGVHNGYFPDMH